MDAARALPRGVAGIELHGHSDHRPLSHLAGRTTTRKRKATASWGVGRCNLRIFATMFARKLFGGALFDQNGYPPFRSPVGPWLWDANVTAFSALLAILLAGILLA